MPAALPAREAVFGLLEGFDVGSMVEVEAFFDGSAEVGEVGFGGVVHESPEGDIFSGGLEESADADGVFGDGVEVEGVSVEAALECERVCDVAEVDVFGARGEGVEFASGVGLDPAVDHAVVITGGEEK